ncbi:MAG: hypothetical protein ACKV19_03550 [Verrucomicrobiales bacterium]
MLPIVLVLVLVLVLEKSAPLTALPPMTVTRPAHRAPLASG